MVLTTFLSGSMKTLKGGSFTGQIRGIDMGRSAKLVGTKFTISERAGIEPCPECGNHTEFRARSKRVGEDHCNVWVICECGFDPTEGEELERYEDVWGGVKPKNVRVALSIWNDMLRRE